MMKLQITGVIWTNEMVLVNNLPNEVDIEAEGNLSDFLKSEISEDFVFTPIKLGKYKIL